MIRITEKSCALAVRLRAVRKCDTTDIRTI